MKAAAVASTNALFYPLLWVFHLFPLHAPITMWLLDAPFGRFSVASAFNLPGNVAWAAMELVAPITFLSTLAQSSSGSPSTALLELPYHARVLAILYLAHYAHRALFSPLVLAPKRAPLHIVVVLAAAVFNFINATLIAGALKNFPVTGGLAFKVGVWIFVLGFLGNGYHDEILHDLRREPKRRLVRTRPHSNVSHGRYRVPYGGLFKLVSFPNYFCEWMEWTGFAIAAAPYVFVSVPTFETTVAALGAHCACLAGVLPHLKVLEPFWPQTMLAAPWAFVLAEVTSMLPRAVRGHKWYQRTFKDYPKRKAVIPGVI